jgi:hypothetical protein
MDKRPDPNTPSFKRISTELQAESLRQQEAYSELWGYTHMLWEVEEHRAAMGRRAAAWGKLLALQEALEQHEFALYLDTDLAVVNPLLQLDGLIDTLLRSGRDLLLSQDANGVNTGVMLLRRSEWSRWLLGELWRVSSSLADCDCIFYYEQRAFHHALQTEQWRSGYKWWTRHIPLLGWFRNPLRGHPPGPTLEELPLLRADGTAATAEEVRAHVEVVPQCALNAVDSYTDAEFIVHFAGQRGRRKERLMRHFGRLAWERLERVAKPLRSAGPAALPLVHQTWKSHELEQVKRAWHMSWLRNGFRVSLRNDTEALEDVERLARETGHPDFVPAYLSLSPVQRADFWRYAITYLEGGIYSDIDIAATPDTARFFLSPGSDMVEEGGAGQRFRPGHTELVGIIENGPYDNSIGRLHWSLGMSPMYSRVPQLRQSFFYARQGHPALLALLKEVARMADVWARSQHTDLGKPGLDRQALQGMAESGALTLEMTGPGVWTDFMLAPLLAEQRARRKGKGQRAGGLGEGEGAGRSVVLSTLEGYSLIRYGSMGSWKTKDHKGDRLMWRNVLAFYSCPLLIALLYRAYAKYQRGKRPKIA